MSEKLRVRPIKSLRTEIEVPGDKSLSHRVAILAGLAKGESQVRNFLPSEDCLNTLKAMAACGVRYEVEEESEAGPTGMTIKGRAGELEAPVGEIDCGNSGTGMRLLAGILAAQNFESRLTGDESLSSRPMGRIIKPLELMGAKIETSGERAGCAPLTITGGKLRAITYEMPMASAQVKSAVLLAGMFAPDKTTVIQPALNRDHTERLCNAFGVKVRTEGNEITIYGGQVPTAIDFTVPGDISSAAFWLVLAAAIPSSKLMVKNVGLNPTRTAILNVLLRMGARITDIVREEQGGEPVGDIIVEGGALTGTEILPEEVPNLIDEVPVLAVAGALAEGRMVIRNARELRVKETDRITTVVENLREMGVEVQEFEDGMEILGGKKLKGARLQSHGDHRIAMAFLIAGLLAKSGETVMEGTACI
ncbi:MAG: 3-phosphoshikimate 1-carboxyvinyltransferase, partial [Verrucomicrobiales bacterium]